MLANSRHGCANRYRLCCKTASQLIAYDPAARAPSIMSMSPEPEEESAASVLHRRRARVAIAQLVERGRAHPRNPRDETRAPDPQREEPLRPRRDGAQPERRRRLPELPDALRRRGRGRRRREHLCGNQPVRRVQFFTKSFLGDDAADLARASGEEPASPRHRAGVASMAWRTTR